MAKILCIEDEAMIRGQIVEELQDAGYEVVEAEDGRHGLEMLLEHQPNIVISDVSMPNMDGRELLSKVRSELPQFADMPFIFLTAFSDRKDVLSGLDLGVDDYLTKPIDFDILLGKVKALLTQVERIDAKNQKSLEYLAYHDLLTGLPNRLSFQERLADALQKVAKQGPFSIIFFDLDQFKRVNDSQGHVVGDEFLRVIAKRLTGCISSTDSLARMGGDEFAIVRAGNSQPADAAALAMRIQQALDKPIDLAGCRWHVTGCFGIATAPNDGDTIERLLKSVDLALHRAKEQGPGKVCYFTPEIENEFNEQIKLEAALRSALSNNQFELHYQPIFDIQTQSIISFEALLRWRHPEGGLVPPAEFIPTAERAGLINTIGEWVIQEACAAAANWPNEIGVAVNLSPAQFRDSKLPFRVAAALAKSGLDARRLELEVTESVLLESSERITDALQQLKALGISLAMDDFGTGYSSLSYLQNYPFDKIKIDRSFIMKLDDDIRGKAIFGAILDLAHALHMRTTAEGIETEEQLALATQKGCDFGQGFLLAKPLALSDADAFLRSQCQDQVA